MLVGIVKETFPGERRVALVPSIIPALANAGCQVLLQSGAGDEAGYPDRQYAEQGGRIAGSRADVFGQADALVQVMGYGANPESGRADLALLRPGQILVGFHDPLAAAAAMREIAATGATVFAMELMPRITRAQSMDALSAMSTVTGYKAVLLAASALPRMFPMLMTAAGTITPARALVIGAGVAGLQAIATARRLGAVVSGYDVRPAAREQVQSMGARFVELPLEAADAEDARGYARAQDEAFYRRQRDLLGRAVAESDVVITTAAVPGRRAPVLLTDDMVAGMAPGSVVVDLAADRGGNCALTRPGETVVAHGVAVLGPLNLATTVPHHASLLYARTAAAFLRHLGTEGQWGRNRDDEITRGTLVVTRGEIVHPRVRQALGLDPLPSTAAATEGARPRGGGP
jgi:NAD(P) transhydrogenase subunit alpha